MQPRHTKGKLRSLDGILRYKMHARETCNSTHGKQILSPCILEEKCVVYLTSYRILFTMEVACHFLNWLLYTQYEYKVSMYLSSKHAVTLLFLKPYY